MTTWSDPDHDVLADLARAAVPVAAPIEPPFTGGQSCAYFGRGFCGASVDGYCIGGTTDGRCHG